MTTDESEELDSLAQKYHDVILALKAQQELNAQLMCEVRKLQSENSRLVRMVRRIERL